MKIVVKQTNWFGWNGGSASENILEYDVELKKEIVVEEIEVLRNKRLFFQSKYYSEIVFSFNVLEIGEDCVIVKTNGTAGGEYNKRKGKYVPKTSTVKFGEILKFSTKTMDAGSKFDFLIQK